MKDDKSAAIFELGLLRKDKIANIIFILGAAITLTGLSQREQSIKQTGTKQLLNHKSTVSKYNLEKSLALSNWIYLIAGIIFIITASANLEQKISTEPMEASLSSEESIMGSRVVVAGDSFKIIGYIMTAIGHEIIAANIMEDKHDKYKKIFELGLIQKDEAANIIFILGAAVALMGLNQREQSIKQTETKQLSNQESTTSKYNLEKSIALSNWIYVIAGIILVNTTSANLQEKIAAKPRKFSLSSEKNIRGSKMVVDGTLFKVIGYIASAIGREIIAESIIDPEIITDSTM